MKKVGKTPGCSGWKFYNRVKWFAHPAEFVQFFLPEFLFLCGFVLARLML